MLPMLALGAMSLAGSVIGGMGAKQASAKQWRLQQIENAMTQQRNDAVLAEVNAYKTRMGEEYLANPGPDPIHMYNFAAAGEALGYNPVTWLNSGALSYFAPDKLAAYKFMTPEYALSQPGTVPQQHSALSGWGAGLSAAASAMGTQYRADQSYDLQMFKMENMLDAGIQRGFGLSQGNGLFSMSSAGTRVDSSSSGALSPFAYPDKWKEGKVEVTHPFQRGFIDPFVSNADVKETRYGEPGDWLFGVDTMVHDAVRNMTGRTLREWGQAAGMNIGDYFKKGDTSWGPSFARWWNSPNAAVNFKLPGFSGTSSGYMPFAGANAY